MKIALVTVLAASTMVLSASGESNFVIRSFSGNGHLIWDAPDAGVYSIEWASSPTGPWSSSWQLAGMSLAAGQYTNSVPMFYRVRAKVPELLMHANGTHGSAVFVDESGHEVTAYGGAQISTNRCKFGGASLHFDGSSGYLSLASSADWAFGSGDFTVDFWANFEVSPSDVSIIGPHTQGLMTEWLVGHEGANLTIRLNGPLVISQPWMPLIDVWYHIALTRSGTEVRLFVDGQLLGSGSSSAAIGNDRPLTLGASVNPSLFFQGYLDEIRIIKGTAKWTAPFTPPTSEY